GGVDDAVEAEVELLEPGEAEQAAREAVGVDAGEAGEVVVREVEELDVDELLEASQVGDVAAGRVELADLRELAGEQRAGKAGAGGGVADAQRVGDRGAEACVGDRDDGVGV